MGDDASIGLVVGGCSRSTVGRSRSVIDRDDASIGLVG